jgi:hypothetical protein
LARQLGVPPDNLKRAADIAAQAVVEGIQIAAEVGRQMQLAADFIVKLFERRDVLQLAQGYWHAGTSIKRW